MSDRKMTKKHQMEAMKRYTGAWSGGLVTCDEVEEGDFRLIYHYSGILDPGHFEIARCDEQGCARFLTHAHTDIPAALGEILRLEKALIEIAETSGDAESRRRAMAALEANDE